MGKYHPIPIEVLEGKPYGITLRRGEDGTWARHRGVTSLVPAEHAPSAEAAGEEVYEHNQNLGQDGGAQSLSPSEVREMKNTASGEQVVEALASNSATFASKTKFSQEKYLRKKAQKHVQQVVLLRPSLMELCETYMQQARSKVCGLRWDYLSSLVCQADIRDGGRYLVLDSACGLVVGAIAQQAAGRGKCFRLFRGGMSEKALLELDLGDRRHMVRQIPVDVLACQEPLSHNWLAMPEVPRMDGEPSADDAAKFAGRQRRVAQRRVDVEDLLGQQMDALIVVAGDEDAELANEVLELGVPRLAPGGRVVIYGQHLQPLATRQGSMRASGDFVDVRMHQLFTREYQVLPMRTHPIMTAEANLCEGFLLVASKVIESADTTASNQENEGAGGGGGKRRRRR